MRWHHILEIPKGITDADPIAAPANVPTARLVDFRARESNTMIANRLIGGLHAPTGEAVSVEIYALDERDEEVKNPALWRWSLVASFAISGGGTSQTDLLAGPCGFVGGGRFYVRVTANSLVSTRELVFRATT